MNYSVLLSFSLQLIAVLYYAIPQQFKGNLYENVLKLYKKSCHILFLPYIHVLYLATLVTILLEYKKPYFLLILAKVLHMLQQ